MIKCSYQSVFTKHPWLNQSQHTRTEKTTMIRQNLKHTSYSGAVSFTKSKERLWYEITTHTVEYALQWKCSLVQHATITNKCVTINYFWIQLCRSKHVHSTTVAKKHVCRYRVNRSLVRYVKYIDTEGWTSRAYSAQQNK